MLSDSIKAILLDIEGTTTPVDFVYGVLFPYASAHLEKYVRTHPDLLAGIHDEYQADQDGRKPDWDQTNLDGATEYLQWLISIDRKSTVLKKIQGMVWEEGYRSGELRGVVFKDVPHAFLRWTQQGKRIYIFSSGSVLAQKLIFGSSDQGDLTPFLSGYFDTETGPKRAATSYAAIANETGYSVEEMLFVSDVTEELAAAHEAGMQTVLAVRPGNHPCNHGNWTVVNDFTTL